VNKIPFSFFGMKKYWLTPGMLTITVHYGTDLLHGSGGGGGGGGQEHDK
jgi:hypothetical protein